VGQRTECTDLARFNGRLLETTPMLDRRCSSHGLARLERDG